MSNSQSAKSFPSVKIKIDSSHINIETEYVIRYKQKDSEKFICIIPEFNVFYVTKNKEEIKQKGDAFIDSFFCYHLETDSKHSLKKLAVNLHRLGFKTSSNKPMALANMMRNIPDANTSFKRSISDIPSEFLSASTLSSKNKFSVLA